MWVHCGNLQGQPVTNGTTNGSRRLGVAAIVTAAAVGFGVWAMNRPTYAELIDAEQTAEAGLHLCQLTPNDCTKERATYEKAHARVIARTP